MLDVERERERERERESSLLSRESISCAPQTRYITKFVLEEMGESTKTEKAKKKNVMRVR
jgi:hypothetical protein